MYGTSTSNTSGYLLHIPATLCFTCQTNFPSRNKLFKHLRDTNHKRTSLSSFRDAVLPTVTVIIKSNASHVTGSGMAFRGYNYLEIMLGIKPVNAGKSVCMDTVGGMSVFDRNHFKDEYPDTAISDSENALKVRFFTPTQNTSTHVIISSEMLLRRSNFLRGIFLEMRTQRIFLRRVYEFQKYTPVFRKT
jgi:hypothetical protein